ncbi:hypothetical protein JTE90_009519 [Oedothorax gibbosus]|uniref:Zinc finger CCHC domain-containing protein 7 n=1 Tax=Oedothorax gibbosus TaxID=931172 RepID=A0AAV6USS8_9ARAC|nr:hypothetical protein JTE90_009519 [Oedothorax gibbosus]
MYEDDSSVQSWAAYSETSFDSDKIDSDIEAELYSAIHHETIKTPSSDLIPNTDLSIDDEQNSSSLYNSCETPEVKVIKDFSFSSSQLYEVSGSDCNTTIETSDVCDTNINEKPDVMNGSVNGNTSTPDVKVTTPNFKRKFEVLIKDLESTPSISLKSNEREDIVKTIARKKKKLNKSGSFNGKPAKSSVSDSSDSDSIIWSEDDDVQPIEIQTNLNKEFEVVALSSDSSSDESFDPLDDACMFKGGLGSSQLTDQPSSSKDPWHINSEDLYRRNKRGAGSRYHENAVLHCTNCKLKGHTFKFCSAPKTLKCFICGEDHLGANCQYKVCKKCYHIGHDSRFCNQRFVEFCPLCNMRGHPVKYCPDLWRRYHVTTKSGKVVVANSISSNSPVYCFNCGEMGHNGAMCRVAYPDKFSFPTWTSVIAHEHPNKTIKKSLLEQRHVAMGGTPNWSPITHYQQQNFAQSQTSPKKMKKLKNKKKKKKLSLNTSKDGSGPSKSKDFSFPRTPKPEQKKKGKRKNQRPFLAALQQRFGISSNSDVQNKFV